MVQRRNLQQINAKNNDVEKYIQWGFNAVANNVYAGLYLHSFSCSCRAGLTIRHGTHVRRAPGWKGAPE